MAGREAVLNPLRAVGRAAGVSLCLVGLAWGSSGTDVDRIALGKELALTRSKGNCIACHAIDDGKLPGNVGPPLMSMQLRFPDRETLRRQIWDPTARNPNTMMPPFGKHEILSDDEIEAIVDYLYTL
jgi:sulfur-oxidizing protein SoxX